MPPRSKAPAWRALALAGLAIVVTAALTTLTDVGIRELIEMLR